MLHLEEVYKVEAALLTMILFVFIGSVFLNIVLVNQRDYHKSGERFAGFETSYWKGLALLYEKELRVARK